MIIVTGEGKIIKNLDHNGVIEELKKAQTRGDRFCSVTGAYSEGYDPAELDREAGYKIGATEAQCHAALSRIAGKGGSSRSAAKQKSSRENGKLGGRPKTKKS